MGFCYTAKQLLEVARTFRERPKARYRVPGMWPEVILTREEWRQWFRRCLDAKITSKMPPPKEPTCCICGGPSDCDRTLRQAQRQLNRPRLIIDWLPPCLRVRFAHRLREAME